MVCTFAAIYLKINYKIYLLEMMCTPKDVDVSAVRIRSTLKRLRTSVAYNYTGNDTTQQ